MPSITFTFCRIFLNAGQCGECFVLLHRKIFESCCEMPERRCTTVILPRNQPLKCLSPDQAVQQVNRVSKISASSSASNTDSTEVFDSYEVQKQSLLKDGQCVVFSPYSQIGGSCRLHKKSGESQSLEALRQY